MTRSSSRVVAITGASAGIGRACAERLSQKGAAVVLSARRADRLTEIAAAITAGGGRAIAVPGDVTSESDMRALVAAAVAKFGRLDVMICNAGIGYHEAFGDTPTTVMRRLVDVNLMGTLYAAHAAVEVFSRQGSGHVIAVSSIVGRRGIAGSSVYGATKAAQLGLIESLRTEFIGTNLHASVVFPVGTDTEFRESIKRDFGHEVTGHGPRQSADQVAAAIADCIATPRAEVYPLPRAWWLGVLSVLAPAQADKFVHKYGRRASTVADDRAGS